MRNMNNNKKNRILSFDMLRIVGAVSVLLTHISAYIIIFFEKGIHYEWISGNTVQLLVYEANPIFLMLSGALLLQEKRSKEGLTFYKRSLMPAVILTIGWVSFYGLFYAVILPLLENRSPDFQIFLDYFFKLKGSDYPHLWYMYMLIGLYLTIPILRLIVKKENIKYILIFVLISVIAQFIPEFIDPYFPNDGFKPGNYVKLFHLQPFMGQTAYLLLGWFIVNFEIKKPVRIGIYSLAVLFGAINFIGLKEGFIVRDSIFNGLSIASLLWGVAVFMAIYYFFRDKTAKTRIAGELAKLSFGVYALHVLFLELFVRFILPYDSFVPQEPVLYIAVAFVCICGISLLISFLMSRIRGLKAIIRYK